jgi:hypothetical protein
MKQRVSRVRLQFLVLAVLASWPIAASAQTESDGPNGETVMSAQSQNTSDILNKVDQLVEQNKQLEKQNQELIDQIQVLRQRLVTPSGKVPESDQTAQPPVLTSAVASIPASGESDRPADTQTIAEAGRKWGTYTPGLGFKVADTNYGDMNISLYSYVRYLNQRGLADSYTNYFGNVTSVQPQNNFQILKVQLKFLGWVMSPKFRYFLYTWTSNASQGQGAQVVVAGNLGYTFNKYITLSGGINALPGVRSLEGNFPYWLSVDTRQIADEFFRPSYTSGIWARGQITNKLRYQAMLGNNLSQLGVSALQLDNGLNTVSTALVWAPSTGEFGAGFGDFEHHESVATRLAVHFTRSHEDKQSQPNTEAIQNTQIRLTDGSIIFTPNLFGPGITVNDVNYQMTSVDSGVKYHGYAVEGEYYFRWLNNFGGPGTAGLSQIFDHGFQVQTSTMVVPKSFQLYLGGSTVFGKYGHPWDIRAGMNWFPWKNRVVRWNTEGLYLYNSPVGYSSVPFQVGGHGFVFHSNFEMAF